MLGVVANVCMLELTYVRVVANVCMLELTYVRVVANVRVVGTNIGW